jgi:hypothetical protein
MFVPYNRTFGADIRNSNTIKSAICFHWAKIAALAILQSFIRLKANIQS